MAYGFGKVILLGEHAVVYGKGALVCGLSRGVRAEPSHASNFSLHIQPWQLRIEHGTSIATKDSREHSVAEAFCKLIESYGPTRASVAITVTVDLEPSAGLGCSAALGVALVRAINKQLGIQENSHAIEARALEWEKVFHGNPSGVDTAAATYGGLLYFSPERNVETVSATSPFFLVIAHSGQSSLTKDMVSSVKHQHEKDPRRVGVVIDGIESLVLNAKSALEQGDLEKVGTYLSLNHALLSSLLLCTPKLDEMCERAKTAGALGAKVTGAGGGGCMLALCRAQGEANAVKQALSELSALCVIESVGG
ncbi:MAG: mevalonate kinase [Myxococcales bacterium]|nr:MAG: mevalonate kinase [Myxococcales bacterium]